MPGTEQLTVRAIAISWWGLTRLIRSLLSWIVSDDNASARVSHIAESWQHSKQGGGCCHATEGSAAISCPFFWLRQQICSFQGATFTSMGLHSPLQKRWIWIKGEAWVIEGDAHTLPSCCRSKWVQLPNETLLLHPFGTYLSYLSISIYPYLSISIHIYLSLYLSIYPSIYLSIYYLSTYLPTYGTSCVPLMQIYDLGFHVGGAFFWILSFFCSKSLASDDCCIGGFSLAGPNRSVRTSPLASSLSLVYCYTSDCFSVYIYIIIIIIYYYHYYYHYYHYEFLFIEWLYIYMYKYVRVIDSIPERSSVLTVGQPFRCSDSVTIEAAMEWECIYCNGWIWEYRIWNIICNSHGISWHIIIRYHKTREYNGIPYMIFQTISKSNPTYIYI